MDNMFLKYQNEIVYLENTESMNKAIVVDVSDRNARTIA